MSLSITVLVENEARDERFPAEHGLAFWLECGGCRILFDTGQSDIILNNAETLGVDLAAADAVVLSHGHYDHTGGLAAVLAMGGAPEIFVHPAAFEQKYSGRDASGGHFAGMSDGARDMLRKAEQRVVFTESVTAVCGGFFVTGEIPRITDYEDTGGNFFVDESYSVRDALLDDQAGFIDTPDGIVVVLGCAHAGVINTLLYIMKQMPGRPIHAVIGGMHLSHANQRRVDETIKMLREFDIKHIFPLHCTGDYVVKRLHEEFGSRIGTASAGTVLRM